MVFAIFKNLQFNLEQFINTDKYMAPPSCYKIDRENKTRKKKKMVEHFYYGSKDIIERLHIGGGKRKISIKTRSDKESNKFKKTLIELGWNPEYVNHTFRYLTDKLLQNWSDDSLIEEIFGEFIEEQGWKNTIHESLMGIGIREDVAMKLETILEPLLDSSYTHEQLLNIAIEYILGDYKPIAPESARFLHSPEVINEWSDITINRKKYPIYNIPHYCNHKIVKKEIENNLSMSDDYQYYFHATTWKGSNQIMKRIDHGVGRTCLDFGKRPGFYLATTIEDSIEWCTKKMGIWSNETSILVFRIPTILPSTIALKHIKENEWIAVTKESRECKDKMNEIESLWDYDLLYGNMVSNPTAVKERRELPKTHGEPKQQLVGKTDTSDRFLQSCLMGCFYFQKNRE
jgi:hypothetical protein